MIAIIKKSQITASRLLLLAISALFFGGVHSVAAQNPVTVNAGTRLMIRTETVLNTGKTKKGERFTAVLESNLMAGDVTIAKKGAKVYGKVVAVKKAKRGGPKMKQAKLVIQLTDIMINKQLQPIVSDDLTYDTDKPKTLKKVAKAAAIGGIIGGKKGAKRAAAVRGSIETIKKGEQIFIDKGSLMEFRLMHPLVINSHASKEVEKL